MSADYTVDGCEVSVSARSSTRVSPSTTQVEINAKVYQDQQPKKSLNQ